MFNAQKSRFADGLNLESIRKCVHVRVSGRPSWTLRKITQLVRGNWLILLMPHVIHASSTDGPRSPVADKSSSKRVSTDRRSSIVVAREKYQNWVSKEKEAMRQIFHPNYSPFLVKWDNAVACFLIFTATVTPFEVSFLQSSIDALFVVNRIADLVFMFDIWVQTRLAYFDHSTRTWVIERKDIINHYARGWMTIDIVSTIPYDLFDFFLPAPADGAESSAANLKILRVLKILKLFKLLRMIKGAKVFTRLQQKYDISNSSAALMQYFVGMFLLIHWIACMWGLGPAFNDHSWAHERGFIASSPAEMYLLWPGAAR